MKNLLYSSIILFLFIGCSESEFSKNIKKEKLVGVVQKGPYVSGTMVLINELDSELTQTGKVFTSTITDDLGSFELNNIELKSQFVELTSSGFYYNEFSGKISESPLTLSTLSDISDKTSININVLTHLEKRRVEKLIKEGKSFKDSKKQSRDELLSVFLIKLENDLESENFDILKNSEEGGILLSISLLFQGNNSVGQLTQLLSKFQNDLSDNGKIDDNSIKKSLFESLLLINKKRIRDSLKERFEPQKSGLQIPNFEKYLDIFESSYPIDPNFYLSENKVTCLCPNSKPGELSLLNGKIMESVDNEMLLKRIRDVNEKGEPKMDLSRLCTSLVSSMKELFVFSYPVGNIQSWDVSNVVTMKNIFYSNKVFNGTIGIWDVKNVNDMSGMFQYSNFNQDISKWCVTKIPNEPPFFSNDSPLSSSNKPKWGTCPD